MNQAMIVNDDYEFNYQKNLWQCTAMLSGEKILIQIDSNVLPEQITQDIKFDWEYEIEEWLETNEPNNNEIVLKLK